MTPETPINPHLKLSRFLCQEMLYDYVSGRLDEHRVRAIEEYLAGCRDSQRELEKVRRAMVYCDQAAGIGVAPALLQALQGFEPQWKKRLRELTLWSSQRGWKMLPYAFVFLALVLGVTITKPWRQDAHQDTILAEQLKKEPDMLPADSPERPATTPAPAVEPTAVTAPDLAENPPANSVGVVAATNSPATSAPAAQAPAPSVSSTAAAENDRQSREPVSPKGYLMRGDLDVADFHNTWPAVRDKIVALGGKVAGNVELGWLRKKDQSYFHFSLPESNYAELELYLGTFGQVRFSREAHPRVMPESQMRIILTVKDGAPNETPAETP